MLDSGAVRTCVFFALFVACTGEIGTSGVAPNVDRKETSAGGQGGGDELDSCAMDAPLSAFAPVRRLTRTEYNNTIRDLLGDDSRPADSFPNDEAAGGFFANAVAPVDTLQFEHYFDASETIARKAVTGSLTHLLNGCDAADRGCVERFVEDFGARAFRRPLNTEMKTPLMELYDFALARWTPPEAIQMVLQTMLSSPYFLYHLEAPPQGDAVEAVDGYALAARLSYFFWQSIPDDELFVAASGDLTGDADLEFQIRRMLADDRARAALRSFHIQWLGLEDGESLATKYKDPDKFPMWSEKLAAAMTEETMALADEVILNGDGRLETLLTAPYTFIDSTMAPIYGLELSGDGPRRVELDSRQRAGLITQPGFLTSQAHATESSWVLRGKFVRERVLCEHLPPPPPDVKADPGNSPDRLENPACKTCHLAMDPIGFGLENFDALGRWRDVDASGKPIDGIGEISDLDGTDVAGRFQGPRELAERLAGSDQVKECVVTSWFQFAVRRDATGADMCSMRKAFARFADSGGDIKELMMAVAMSDSFRHHTGGEL